MLSFRPLPFGIKSQVIVDFRRVRWAMEIRGDYEKKVPNGF
jgi:hypothetical protein